MTNTQKLYLILTILIFISLSCDSGVETENDKIDLSNYEWTVDTLMFDGAYQISMTSIWGSDKNNVYTCGHSSPGVADLWRYDGGKWIIIPGEEYSDKANARPDVIDGTAAHDIWIGGRYDSPEFKYKPFVTHYDGVNWNVQELNGSKEKVTCLHSIGLNQVYVGGDWGAIWYYDGQNWEKDILEFNVGEGTNCKVFSIIKFNDEIHLLVSGTDIVNNDTKFWYLSGSMGNWKIKNYMVKNFQNVSWDFAYLDFFQINKELYTYRPGIFKLVSKDKWERVFPELTDNMAISDVETIGENQFIAIGEYSNAHFYNGNVIESIKQIPQKDVIYWRLDIIDKEIFIIGYMRTPPFSTAIFHGKPKE